MIKICPRCNQRYLIEGNEIDVVHECGDIGTVSEVLRNDDVVKIGDWSDFTGTGNVQQPLQQGLINENFGTRAGIDGEDSEPVTSRGNRTSTHRTRKHEEFIVLKEN